MVEHGGKNGERESRIRASPDTRPWFTNPRDFYQGSYSGLQEHEEELQAIRDAKSIESGQVMRNQFFDMPCYQLSNDITPYKRPGQF